MAKPIQANDTSFDRPLRAHEDALVNELLERCLPLLSSRNWTDRLAALMQLHDQLRDDVRDLAVFCNLFPRFIERVVERMGGTPVTTLEQAQIYANSANPGHRQVAGAWLERHYAAKHETVNA
jgi:hypothetical protein